MGPSMYRVHISRSALEHNINVLAKNVVSYFPVIKHNAYGHGLVNVAKLCLSYPVANKLAGFGVGTVQEAIELRKSGINQKILALLGEIPLSDWDDIAQAKEHNIILSVHDKEGLKRAVENNISFAIKWNTGMNRFGFTEAELPYVLEFGK